MGARCGYGAGAVEAERAPHHPSRDHCAICGRTSQSCSMCDDSKYCVCVCAACSALSSLSVILLVVSRCRTICTPNFCAFMFIFIIHVFFFFF